MQGVAGGQLPGSWGVPPFMFPPPPPQPGGVPTRWPFVLGAVGHFFAAGASIAYGIGMLLFSRYSFGFFGGLLGLVLGVVLSAALLLHLAGLYGMWRNYGSRLGASAFAFGLAAVLVFLLANVLALVLSDCTYYCYPSAPGVILGLTSLVLLGILFILEGAAYTVTWRFTWMWGSAIAAGVLFIVSGSFITSVLLAVFGGFFMLVPALIIGGIVLLMAPPPRAPVAYQMAGAYGAGPPPSRPPP